MSEKTERIFEIYVNTASIRVLKLREFCVEQGDGKTAPLVVAADNSFIYNQLLEAFYLLSMMNAMVFCLNGPEIGKELAKGMYTFFINFFRFSRRLTDEKHVICSDLFR